MEPFAQLDIEESKLVGEQETLNEEEQKSDQPIAAEVQLEGSTEPFVTGEIPQSETEAAGNFGEILEVLTMLQTRSHKSLVFFSRIICCVFGNYHEFL